MLGADDIGPAKYSELMVTVNINDLDEPGNGYLRLTSSPRLERAWTASLRRPGRRFGCLSRVTLGLCRRSRGPRLTMISTG